MRLRGAKFPPPAGVWSPVIPWGAGPGVSVGDSAGRTALVRLQPPSLPTQGQPQWTQWEPREEVPPAGMGDSALIFTFPSPGPGWQLSHPLTR